MVSTQRPKKREFEALLKTLERRGELRRRTDLDNLKHWIVSDDRDLVAKAAEAVREHQLFERNELDEMSKNEREQLLKLYIAAWIHTRRDAMELSIRELARYSGVDSGYISRIERLQGSLPSREVVQKLASVLGSPPHQVQELLDASVSPPSGEPRLLEDPLNRKVLKEFSELPEELRRLLKEYVSVTARWVAKTDQEELGLIGGKWEQLEPSKKELITRILKELIRADTDTLEEVMSYTEKVSAQRDCG